MENDGELEVIPTEPPLWFLIDLPYEFNKISDNEMELIQFSSEDLYGPTTLIISYKQIEDNWIIDDVTYNLEGMDENIENNENF